MRLRLTAALLIAFLGCSADEAEPDAGSLGDAAAELDMCAPQSACQTAAVDGGSPPGLAPVAYTLNDQLYEGHEVRARRYAEQGTAEIQVETPAGTLLFRFELASLGVEGALSVGFHAATEPNVATFLRPDGTRYSSAFSEAPLRFGMAFLEFAEVSGGVVDARFGGQLSLEDGSVIDLKNGRLTGEVENEP